MLPSLHRRWSFIILVVMVLSLLPQALVQAQSAAVIAEEFSAPATVTVPPLTEQRLPSLFLDIQATPETLNVGDQATISVTVSNRSIYPATNLVVDLPLPDGTTPTTKADLATDGQGWRWTVAELAGNSSQTFVAALQLNAMPQGAAVLARPQVAASELALPITDVGGALVHDVPTATPATTAFKSGTPATLRSADQRVTVQVPAGLLNDDLQLTYRTLAEKRQSTKDFQAPAAIVGFKRGLGTFFLDATNARGQAVHQFKEPVTISVRYTPEQLLALGIAEADLTIFWYNDATKIWEPQLTYLDAATQTASTKVSHFSAYALSDGSSPSEAFIPSLQGWQVGLYNGAANYGMGIDVPAGPAGVKPGIQLSYNSASSDGTGGMRAKGQAGWVGQGWSLDLGSVSYNKLMINQSTAQFVGYYSFVVNGISSDLVRAEALDGNTGTTDPNPTHWAWRSTDESFVKIQVIPNGFSNTSRGAQQNGQWLPRYTWRIWTKDGTRHDFTEDLWWGWDNCAASNTVDFETYKWQLSQTTDVHSNTIKYQYGRNSFTGSQLHCAGTYGQGTADTESWPTAITWGGNAVTGAADRYKVEFVANNRSNDLALDGADQQYGFTAGQPRQTKRLDAIRVWSMPTNPTWQLVRQYNLTYNYTLLSDNTITSTGVYTGNLAYPRLTLEKVTRVGNDGVTALPPMTFTYGTTRGTTLYPNGAWNRLTQVNNGQGGTISFVYENIGTVTGKSIFQNNRRVTTRTTTDGRGNSYPTTYSYTSPAYNSLGSDLEPWSNATQVKVNSATVYYNKYWNAGQNNTIWMLHKPFTEFRGHASAIETNPNGHQTEHWFYQGDVGCNPVATGGQVINDACFIQLRDREILKGKEYKTVSRGGAGSATLSEVQHSFGVTFLGYSDVPLSGLWRAFSYESETKQLTYEGTATPVTKRTTYAYDPIFANGSGQADGIQYGNLTVMDEYDATNALYRRTRYQYESKTTGGYIVDRKRAETVVDGLGRVLAQTVYQYDGNTTQFGVGTKGNLTLVRKYFNIPLTTNLANVVLQSVDTAYDYDLNYGNQTTVTTYAAAGTKLYNGSTTTLSAPGAGSTATTTTIVFDSVFHAFSTSVTTPPATAGATPLVETAAYDFRMGTLTSVTDMNLNTTYAEYDTFGRFWKLIKPGDTSALPTVRAEYGDTELPFRYTSLKRIESGVNASVQRSSQFYNGLGQKIQIKTETTDNAQSVVVDTQYDGLGQPHKESQPRFLADTDVTIAQYTPTPASGVLWTTKTYDPLGRPLTITTPDGAQTRKVYELNGTMLLSNTIDPKRHRTQQRTDVFGRLVQVVEISGTCGNYWGYTCATGEPVWAGYATTTYAYNPLDLLTTVTDGQNNGTTMTYDSLGRKLTMADPDMGAWAYTYDVDGNLLTQRDAKNQTITLGYDNLSRLTSKVSPNAQASSYFYDEAFGSGKGQRTSMRTSSNGVQQTYNKWTYNPHGEVSQEQQDLDGIAYVANRTYLANGLLKTLQYPTGETLTYAYNDAGQQKSITSSYGNTYLTTATYDALGQTLTQGFGNAVTATSTYESLSKRLSSIVAVGANGPSNPIFHRAYRYDLTGNVQNITNAQTSETLRYGYDHRDRLTAACAVTNAESATCLGGSTFNQSYAYDKIGNLTSKAGVAYTYPANGSARPHAVSTVGGAAYTYDTNGNLLTGGGRTYTWNAENQPTQITSGGSTETYLYDGDNTRVKKTSTTAGVTTSTRYVLGLVEYTGNKTISSYDGIAVRSVVGTYSINNQGELVYLHSDHLGSVSATSNAAGTVAQAQNFDPWGAVRSGGITSTEFNYTGQRKDAGTGLLFYNARYYDPVLARFTQADSIVPNTSHRALTVDFHESGFRRAIAGENNQGFWFQMDGQERQNATTPWGPGNPQELNRYSYVTNNPLNYVDPTGHEYESGGDSDYGYESMCTDDGGKSVTDCTGRNDPYLFEGQEVVAVWITEADGSRWIKYFAAGSPELESYKDQIDRLTSAKQARKDAEAVAATAVLAMIAICVSTAGVGCPAAIAAAVLADAYLIDMAWNEQNIQKDVRISFYNGGLRSKSPDSIDPIYRRGGKGKQCSRKGCGWK